MKSERQAGFTLIELLVTLVIVAIVSAIAVVSLINALDKAKQRATMADMRTISSAIEAYLTDHAFPPVAGTAQQLIETLESSHSRSLPHRDHWGYDYTYAADVTGAYTLESHGKDGTPGAKITQATRFDFELDIVLANGKFVAAPE